MKPELTNPIDSILDHMRTGVVLSDETGRILYASAAIQGILGYSANELIRDTGRKLVHPDDLGRQRDAHMDLLSRPGGSRISIARYLHKDGTYRWIESRIKNLLEDPPVGAILSEFRDVTEHKAAEECAQERGSVFEALAERLPVPILLFARGVVRYANVACLRLLRETQEEIQEAPIASVMGENLASVALERMRCADTDEPSPWPSYRFERRADGTPVAVEIDAFEFSFHGEEAVAVIMRPPSALQTPFSARRRFSLEPWLTHILEHARALEAELTAAKTRTPETTQLLTEVVEAVLSIRSANREGNGGKSDFPPSQG